MLHEMKLQKKYFNYIKNGTIRLNDEKRKKIQKNDIIRFWSLPDHTEYFDTIATDLKQYHNFNEVLEEIPIKKLASISTSKEEYLNDLNRFYSKEEQEQDGVLAITLELAKKREKSCGCILFYQKNKQLEVLLIKHIDGHYGFPKGHIEENETEEETAIRETKEETNVNAKIIPGFRDILTYSPKEHIIKDVVYFVGKVSSNQLHPQFSEISETFWINVEDANKMIFSDEINLLKEAVVFYKNSRTEEN